MPHLDTPRIYWEVVDLPQLIGTEKQVRWAEVIRSRLAYGRMYSFVGMLHRLVAEHPDHAPADWFDRLNAIADRVFSETSAKWWIDHRYDSVHWLMGWRDPTEAAERMLGAALRGGE